MKLLVAWWSVAKTAPPEGIERVRGDSAQEFLKHFNLDRSPVHFADPSAVRYVGASSISNARG